MTITDQVDAKVHRHREKDHRSVCGRSMTNPDVEYTYSDDETTCGHCLTRIARGRRVGPAKNYRASKSDAPASP